MKEFNPATLYLYSLKSSSLFEDGTEVSGPPFVLKGTKFNSCIFLTSSAEVALKYDQALIGINNRNLKTLDVSISNTISIFEILKNHKGPLISESGIKNEKDAKYIYEKTGIKNFLIGESLLKSDNTAELMKRFTQIIQ